MRRSLPVLVVVIGLALPPAFAKAPHSSQAITPTPQAQAQKWTVDDLVQGEEASGFQVSPDGRRVVWVKGEQVGDSGDRTSNLILSGLADHSEIELTRGPPGCQNPKWSPDGRLIAFLTTRPPPTATPPSPEAAEEQLWVINPLGGEPWVLTDSVRGLADYGWADPDTLVFASQEDPSLYESNHKETKDDAEVVEDGKHQPPVRLFKVSLTSKEVKRLTENEDAIQSLALSPDGRHAVTVHQRSLSFAFDNRVKPATYLYDLETGERRQVLGDRKFNVTAVRWTRDGKGFYAANAFSSDPRYVMATVTELYYYDLAANAVSKVDLGWDNGLSNEAANEGTPAFHVTGDGFLALLADGVHNKAARYTRQGDSWRRAWLEGEHAGHLFGLKFGKDDKTLLYAYSTASTPTRWYAARLDHLRIQSPAPLADPNQGLRDKPLARTEVIHWKGALDEEVEGILYYPHDYRAGHKYPLVVSVHPGPMLADFDAWSDSWSSPQNLLNQRGAFVFKANYHGSTNYGLRWVESISGGKYYDLELPDIEKGVDALIGRGLADPDRLGVMGFSNGAILAIALTTRTTRYKAASVASGDAEQASDWGCSDCGAAFDNYYFGKSPLEDPRLYIEKSPFYRMDQVRTPTLIFFGKDDRTVGPHEGWVHSRALQQAGKVPVRFLLFPGEGHGLGSPAHQRRKLEEELAWFDRYLFGSPQKENESLKPDSPLDRALKLKRVKHEGRRYGLVQDGLLIPETVRRDDIKIGRFEVTRAQFAQFDKGYEVEPGKENYPANGVSFEQAQAYCAWLSKATGRTYRLPDEEEAEALYEKSAGAENTLDAWAGYAVNPDDAARLRQPIQELGGGAPLLKEVGSFQGVGDEDPVFDLGGNVAEWGIGTDGKGRPFGGSADTPADPKLGTRHPAPEYIGFRVVQDAPGPAPSG